MAADHVTIGAGVLAASAAGLVTGGFSGFLDFPIGDFAAASMFAIFGIVGRQMLDAKDARGRALAAGQQAPSVDWVSLIYAMFAAPLIGGVALAMARMSGAVPDYAAAPVIMAAGYMGRDVMNLAISVASNMLRKKGEP